MKSLMLLTFFVILNIELGYTRYVNNQSNTVYGYFKRFGIPEYKRIMKAESVISTTRITGGVPAAPGQYPYQVGLISDIAKIDEKAVCGGSLISENRILTAAHCWFDGENQAWRFTIILGSIYLFRGGTKVQTSAVQVHPHWNPYLVRNDIAIIFMQVAVEFSDTISPIGLPNHDNTEETYAVTSAIAAGFGIIADDANVTESQVLSHVRLKIIPNFFCSLAYPFTIHETNICTSGLGGYSICRGDSGGPLVADTKDGQILIGIASFGSSFGCELGFPTVFTRVLSYMPFIKGNLK